MSPVKAWPAPKKALSFQAVVPALVDADKYFRLALLNAAAAQARDTVKSFKETTEHWEHHSILWGWKKHLSKTEMGFTITMNGGQESLQIWHWLDKGTSIRFAVMTQDFEPKTRPNTFATGPGQGGADRLIYPTGLPGIAARGWTKLAEWELQNYKWPYRIQKALDDAARWRPGGGAL